MTVRRRHVFFVSGFDPKGASYYHGLYRSQAALQAVVSGLRFQVGPRVRLPDGGSTWCVACQSGRASTQTVYEYARWDDIVRAHWPRTGLQVMAAALRVYGNAMGWAAPLQKVWRRSPRTLVSLAYPAAYWLFALVVAAVGAWAAARAAGALLPLRGLAAYVAGFAAAATLWMSAISLERRINTMWLVRIYDFAILWAKGELPELEQRIDAFAQRIQERLRDPQVDEVLLVGFSVGTMLAVSVAARVQQGATAAELAGFNLLTLGHCIPLLGLIPEANDFRDELRRLGGEPRVRWNDYSSPTDWGSFALVEPISFCLNTSIVATPPRMASPRFHTMFGAERYALLRRDKRRMHLQYLMAGELPSQYDYFSITAGPQSMRDACAPPAPDEP
jgi:hypothetical protein